MLNFYTSPKNRLSRELQEESKDPASATGDGILYWSFKNQEFPAMKV
jgi:hypothetical protein